MDSITKKIDYEVELFLNKISPKPEYVIQDIDISKLYQDTEYWQDWANNVGIYIFIENDQIIHYIGRALRKTLFGARISSHTNLKSYPETSDWGKTIRKSQTRIRLYKFIDYNDDYWVAGLELKLFDIFTPAGNSRRG